LGAGMTWADGPPTLGTLYSSKLVDLLGPPKQPDPGAWADLQSAENRHYTDVAASLQAMLEEAELSLTRMLQCISGQRALCIAGGVGLNSTFNGKVRLQTQFEDVFVQPAASDAGTSLGVAYYIHHQLLGRPRKFVMSHAFTGPEFDDDAIAAALQRHGLESKRCDEETLC